MPLLVINNTHMLSLEVYSYACNYWGNKKTQRKTILKIISITNFQHIYLVLIKKNGTRLKIMFV